MLTGSFVCMQLSLRDNDFEGEIPDFKQNHQLVEIEFSNNRFSGDFASKLSL